MLRLTEQMQTEKTLEGLKTVLEEIVVVLRGWASWKMVKIQNASIGIWGVIRRKKINVPGQKREPRYQLLTWGPDAEFPRDVADVPVLIDLFDVLVSHIDSQGSSALLSALERTERLLAWDAEGRVLVMEQIPGSRDEGQDFLILPIEAYLERPAW